MSHVFDAPWSVAIFLKATFYYHQSSLQGAGKRRRMQLPKCVYCWIYNTNMQTRNSTVCVTCMHHACAPSETCKFTIVSRCMPSMCYTSLASVCVYKLADDICCSPAIRLPWLHRSMTSKWHILCASLWHLCACSQTPHAGMLHTF